jgi:hypothetical protein
MSFGSLGFGNRRWRGAKVRNGEFVRNDGQAEARRNLVFSGFCDGKTFAALRQRRASDESAQAEKPMQEFH